MIESFAGVRAHVDVSQTPVQPQKTVTAATSPQRDYLIGIRSVWQRRTFTFLIPSAQQTAA